MQHHAYVYEGTLAHFVALVADARKRFDFTDLHDPDVLVEQFEAFGIGESRELIQRATLKSTAGRALFVLGVSSITTEAQQALLKLFEEPQQGAVFVLLVPHGVLLPTLRSRCVAYPATLPGDELTHDAKKFLQLPYKDRSAFIAALLKDEDGTRGRAREFVNALEALLYPHLEERPEARVGLNDIAKVRSYLSDRSPSLKMLLEHLAATLPRV